MFIYNIFQRLYFPNIIVKLINKLQYDTQKFQMKQKQTKESMVPLISIVCIEKSCGICSTWYYIPLYRP